MLQDRRRERVGGTKKWRVGGTNRMRKEVMCDREMVARLFSEPAVELIRLGARRSGELRRGASRSGKGFCSSSAGLRHAPVKHDTPAN